VVLSGFLTCFFRRVGNNFSLDKNWFSLDETGFSGCFVYVC